MDRERGKCGERKLKERRKEGGRSEWSFKRIEEMNREGGRIQGVMEVSRKA